MLSPRAGILAGLCAVAAGCQTTSTVGSASSRQETAVVMAKAPAGQVLLDPGMEVQWEVHTAQIKPGQVKGGQGVIGPDGSMAVGPYGACKVAGLTVNQATLALEKHLAAYVKAPHVRLTTTAPNEQVELAWRPTREQRATPTETGETIVVLASEATLQGPGPETPTDNKVHHVSTGESQAVAGQRIYVQDETGKIIEPTPARPSPFERIRGFFRGGKQP